MLVCRGDVRHARLLRGSSCLPETRLLHSDCVSNSVMVIAFFIGGVLSWNLIPFHWDMSFWTTLKASVQSEKYGHPVEHKAEGILIWVLFFSVDRNPR